MSGCEGLTGHARTDRALVALARLLGEISSTASSTDVQLDSRISRAKLGAQPLATKVSGRHTKARMPAARYPRGTDKILRSQPRETSHHGLEGDT